METVVVNISELKKTFEKIRTYPKKKEPLKVIDQYDYNGVYIRSFKDVNEAAEVLNIDASVIRNCCTGGTLRCFKLNCIFLYERDDIEKRMQLIEEKCAPRVVYEYNLDGELLHKWPDSVTAAAMNHCTKHSIIACCGGYKGNLTHKGKIFLYKGKDIQERLLLVKKRNEQHLKWKPIKEYTIDGKFIKDWPNILSAAKYYGVNAANVHVCLQGKTLSCQNRIFLFPEDSIKERLEKLKHRRHKPSLVNKRKIVEYDLEGTVITTWNSIVEAEKYYGIPQGCICRCCRGKDRLTYKNRIFLYKGDNISKRLKAIEKKLKKQKKNE